MDFIFRLMPPARWRIVCMALLVTSVVLCCMSYSDDNLTLQTATLVTLIMAVFGTAFFWRCPRCRRMLPLKNMMNIKRCESCKADIRNF